MLGSVLLIAAAGAVNTPVPLDVAEVVFSKLIDASGPHLVLCLSLNDGDPPTSLLRKLQRPDRTVILGSECRDWLVNHSDRYIMSHLAHFLIVSDFIRQSDVAVQVHAIDRHNDRWTSFWTVRVARDAAGWRIVSFHHNESS